MKTRYRDKWEADGYSLLCEYRSVYQNSPILIQFIIKCCTLELINSIHEIVYDTNKKKFLIIYYLSTCYSIKVFCGFFLRLKVHET
jgi:hypothetical protein